MLTFFSRIDTSHRERRTVADTDSAGLQVSPGSSIFNNFLRYFNLSKH